MRNMFCCAAWALLAGPALAAGFEPVRPGLWQVSLETQFKPDPEPGAPHWPYMPARPRRTEYPLCLDEHRAAEPVPQPAAGGSATVALQRDSDTAFSGHTRIATPAMAMVHRYTARWLAADCAGLAPRAAGKFGEP